MTYTPGTLRGRYRRGDGTPHAGEVQLVPSTSPARDLTGATVVSGAVWETLDEEGEFSVDVAPYGPTIDPVTLTWTVIAHLDDGQLPPVAGIRVEPGEVVEVAEQTSVVPEDDVPNVQRQLEEIRDQAAEQVADATAAAVTAAAGHAAAAASSASDAAARAGESAGSAAAANTAQLGALAAQEAAEAAQAAVLLLVAAATEQATEAAGSATTASEQRALAETARTGAETARAAIPSMPVLSTNLVRNPRPASTSGFAVMGPSVTVTYIDDPVDGPFARVRVPAGTAATSFRGTVFAIGAVAGALAGDRFAVRFEARSGGGWASGFTPSHVAIAPTSAAPLLTGITPSPVTSDWGVQSGITRGVGQAEAPLANTVGIYLRIPAEATTDESWVDIRRVSIVLNDTTGTDYFDGTTAGARWSGAAHASTSELVVARASDVARLGRVGAGVYEGTGSPEGVVIALPGSEYRDRAASPSVGGTGAYVWRKRSGTGATGWVCVDGDTGWRDLTGLFINGWKVNTGGAFAVRRQGSTVWLTFHNLNGEAATNLSLAASLGSAWAVHNPGGLGSQSFPALLPGGTPSTTLSGGIGTGGTPSMNSLPGGSTLYRGLWSWPVNPATWPATLPGTAI